MSKDKNRKSASAKEVRKNHNKTYGRKSDYVDESLDREFKKKPAKAVWVSMKLIKPVFTGSVGVWNG